MPCFRLLGNSRFMRSALPALTLVTCALLPQAALAGARFEVPDYLLRLPEQTYRLIERNFSTLYQQTDFTPQITNSYFNHSDLYRFAGIPLAITPQNGFQMEVFGQLYNKSSQIYAQMSQDLSLYRTLRVDMMGDQSDEIAIGMGLGIPLTTRLTVKALASSNEIPGYGSANYAIGMEWHFFSTCHSITSSSRSRALRVFQARAWCPWPVR